MRKVKYLIPILVLIFLAGCAGRTFIQNTYATISISGTAYDTGMKIISDLQKQGVITQANRDTINKYATVFYNTYHDTVNKFSVYVATANPTDLDKLDLALSAMNTAWVNLAVVVNKAKPGTLSPTLPK